MKPKISDLAKAIKPAPAEKARVPQANSAKVKKAITNRLIANEYLRNGMNIKSAYEAVTKKKYCRTRFSAIVTDMDGAFMREVDTALKAAEVDKNQVLSLLWTLATTSPLDYLDDDGVTLSIAELKKLPRELQSVIEEVFVETTYEKVIGEDGPVKDEEGNLLMVPKQRVRIRVSGKQEALNTYAKIGKLIGPAVVNNNYTNITNIGQAMIDADSRRNSLMVEHAARPKRVIEHKGED